MIDFLRSPKVQRVLAVLDLVFGMLALWLAWQYWIGGGDRAVLGAVVFALLGASMCVQGIVFWRRAGRGHRALGGAVTTTRTPR